MAAGRGMLRDGVPHPPWVLGTSALTVTKKRSLWINILPLRVGNGDQHRARLSPGAISSVYHL